MKAGQKVVCLNNTGAEQLTVNEIYTIRRMIPHQTLPCGVELEEVKQDDWATGGFKQSRFRLVDYAWAETLIEKMRIEEPCLN